jgi:hypothetical protein
MSVLEGRIKSYTAALTLNSRHRQQIKVTFEAEQAFNNVMPRIKTVAENQNEPYVSWSWVHASSPLGLVAAAVARITNLAAAKNTC